MKFLITFFLIFFLHSTNAFEGIVTVYKAPMFSKPNPESRVVQWVEKGRLVKVHKWHFQDFKKISTNNKEFQTLNKWQKNEVIRENLKSENVQVRAENVLHDENYLIHGRKKFKDPYEAEKKKFLRVKRSDFYLTADNMGRDAYIHKEYVKVIFNDKRESKEKINAFTHDPTDFRIKGSLPDTYPYYTEDELRLVFQIGAGTDTKKSYPYPGTSAQLDGNLSPSIAFSLLKKANQASKDYIFYGGMLELNTYSSELQSSEIIIEEKGTTFSIGPKVDLHVLKNNSWSLWVNSQVLFSLSKLQISQTQDEQAESKDYKAWTIRPSIESTIAKRNVYEGYDLLFSLKAQLNLPSTYSSEGEVENSDLWLSSGEEGFQSSLTITPSFLVGFAKEF